jgi:hypothetical protein
MMGSRVEFVDDSVVTEGASAGGRWRRGYAWFVRRVRRQLDGGVARVAALLSWAAAAVLCIAASIAHVFTYRFDGTAIHTRGGFTASGRSLDPLLNSEHGPRYALLFVVCAVWFAGLGVLLITEGIGRAGRLAVRHLTAVSAAASFLLIGVVGSLALGVQATRSSYQNLDDSLNRAGHIEFQFHVGACLWLGIAAVACAATGLVATLLIASDSALSPAQTPIVQREAAGGISTDADDRGDEELWSGRHPRP